MKSNFITSSGIALTILIAATNIACKAFETNQTRSAETVFNQANPKMVWGQITNYIGGDPGSSAGNTLKPLQLSLRAGINVKDGVIVLSGHPLKTSNPADVYLFTDSIQTWVGVPPFNQSVALFMIDSNGASVSKTTKGLALGQLLTLKPKTTFFRWAGNNRNPWLKVFNTAPYGIITIGAYQRDTNSEQNDSWPGRVIQPEEYFSIKTPGLYKLTLDLRLFVVDTNTFLKAISLPPVTVPVRVED